MRLAVSIGIFFKLIIFWIYFSTVKIAIELGYLTNSIATTLLIFLFVLFIRNWKFSFITISLISLNLSFLMVANTIYSRVFNLPVSIELMGIADQLFEIRGSVFNSMKMEYLLFFVPDIIVFFILLIGKVRIRLEKTEEFYLTFGKKTIFVIIVIMHTITVSRYYSINVFSSDDRYHPFVRFILANPVNFYLIEGISKGYSFIFKEKLSERQLEYLKKYFEKRNIERASSKGIIPYESDLGFSKPNFLVIQLESMKISAIKKKINGVSISPVLDNIIDKGWFFSNFYSQAYFTCGSDFGSLSSLIGRRDTLPSFHCNNSFTAIPDILRRHGWDTLAISGSRKTFWNSKRMFNSFGINRFDALEDFNDPEIIGVGVSDKDIFKRSLEMLENSKKPWFFYLMTLTTHHPFHFKGVPDLVKAETGDRTLDATISGDMEMTALVCLWPKRRSAVYWIIL